MSGSGPNYQRERHKKQTKSIANMYENKKDSEWKQREKDNPYPKCIGLKPSLYPDCPKPEDVPRPMEEPHKNCKTCPHFKPTPKMLEERRKQLAELMASMRRDSS